MSHRRLASLSAIAAMSASALLTTIPVAGQSPTTAAASLPADAKNWKPARTAWGDPDLTGIYSNSDESGIPFERPAQFEGRRLEDITAKELEALRTARRNATAANSVAEDRPVDREVFWENLNAVNSRAWLVVDPPDGKIPYQPWALAKSSEVLQHHADPTPQYLDPNARCFLQGVPRHLNNREFEIFQPPGYVVIFNMAHHAYRAIPLNAGPHISDRVTLWMGDSRGRWEGSTLVVDVANNNDRPWFDVVGSFHSDALRVSERFVPIDADTIDYTAVITDPTVYTRPWTMKLTFQRIKDYGSELYEEACFETNERTLELMLTRPGR